MAEICHCGRPLHYRDRETKLLAQLLIELRGEFVIVETPEGRWWVPRHYIALHGLKGSDVPHLGFARADH